MQEKKKIKRLEEINNLLARVLQKCNTLKNRLNLMVEKTFKMYKILYERS